MSTKLLNLILHRNTYLHIFHFKVFSIFPRFRSKLPVVSNLTAMNLWDGVCMFFIYASFIEFILVNYLARWVQDPEQQKKKKENAILDVSTVTVYTSTVQCTHCTVQENAILDVSQRGIKLTKYRQKGISARVIEI